MGSDEKKLKEELKLVSEQRDILAKETEDIKREQLDKDKKAIQSHYDIYMMTREACAFDYCPPCRFAKVLEDEADF